MTHSIISIQRIQTFVRNTKLWLQKKHLELNSRTPKRSLTSKFLIVIALNLQFFTCYSQISQVIGQMQWYGYNQPIKYVNGMPFWLANLTNGLGCSTTSAYVNSTLPTHTCSINYTSFPSDIYINTTSPTSNIKPALSSLDLTKVQNHILGIQLLTAWPQFIAADMDLDKSLTTLDMVKIQRIILGYDPPFIKFFPLFPYYSISGFQSQLLSNPLNVDVIGTVWDYPAYLGEATYRDIVYPSSNYDPNKTTYAVMVAGDVDVVNTPTDLFGILSLTSGNNKIEKRSPDSLNFLEVSNTSKSINQKADKIVNNILVLKEKTKTDNNFSLKFNNDQKINSFQFDIDVIKNNLSILKILPSSLVNSEGAFAYNITDNNIKITWYSYSGKNINLNKSDILFEIETNDENANLLLNTDNKSIQSLIGFENNLGVIEKTYIGISSEILSTSISGSVLLSKNENNYYITFESQNDGIIKYALNDIFGRLVNISNISSIKGQNKIKINTNNLKGTFFVKVSLPNGEIFTKKIILF